MPEPVQADIQQGYDKVAVAYASAFIHEQDHKPMDREMLRRFADSVRGKGPVCDMGCGPGQIAAYLFHQCDLHSVFGMDLSQRFVQEAARLNPLIPFRQGNMLKIDATDNTWAGITAFYCIIHIPHAQVVEALKEMGRVLKPGGLILLTYHIGQESVHLTDWFEEQVSMDFNFYDPVEMETYLQAAGYTNIQTTLRQPYAPEVEHQSHRAYVFAEKPI
ncbi:MAG: class I SAM-dependent methyltransferase [Anaerolineae bacterium]|nr:class I SAM-dependent methyltransferase [Anaerolineae bacterium]